MRGDPDDMLGRLKSLLPPGWFARDTASVRDALLSGLGGALSDRFALLGQVRSATRIKTAGGFWLDLVAWDFFGARFMRRKEERDDPFRVRILAELFRPRATRVAIARAVTDLTGRAPDIFEPWNPGDCGAYGVGTLAYGGGRINPDLIAGYGAPIGGYGVGGLAHVIPNPPYGHSGGAGCYGSLSYPNQIFVTAYRPDGGGIPNVSGYGTPGGGYGMGSLAYVDLSQVEAPVSDAEIYATIAETTAAGVIAWTAIRN